MPNEVEKFLQDTNQDQTKVDVFDAPLTGDTPEQGGEQPKENGTETPSGDLTPRTRRERRLIEKLEKERESSIFLAGKLEARSEAEKSLNEEADYLKQIERIYGTESPEAQLATDLLKKAMVGLRDDAENRAYDRMMTQRHEETQAQDDAEGELDTMIEELEDEHGVTLNEAQQKGFFTLLGKMSPKDRDGNVIQYADHHAVWEIFSERLNRKTPESSRAKELSSRSMVGSSATRESNLNEDAAAKFLRDNGII